MVWLVFFMKNSHEFCTACADAEKNAACHSFNGACQHCAERHFAHLQVFFESRKARAITSAYQAALDQRFGDDGAAAAHENIKVWAKRIDAARLAQKNQQEN
jgi:hypothetical protein